MADYNTVFQNSFYIGNNLNAILYGIYLCLYYLTIRFALRGVRHTDRRYGSSHRLFVLLSTFLLVMITAWVSIQAIFGQEMWVINENYPGGTAQYFNNHVSVWYETMGSVISVLSSAITDGFLVYRLYIVWGLDKNIVVIPAFLFVASIVLGILTCVFSGLPNSDFFSGFASEIALAYSGVSMGLNVLCSSLICARILWLARTIRATLGATTSRPYTSAATIIIESMLPYTVFTTAYLITLGLGSPLVGFFITPCEMFSVLSPQMIMLRVLMGRGLSAETSGDTGRSTVRFAVHTAASTDPEHTNTTGNTAISLSNPSKSSFNQVHDAV
ncbi:uncharacterized protein BXZ73DRAFT_45880 [Epithele typhae]|uniref:uncharacterized protein n=1 Tax=Epithele typhae TaxID=378194 RepID=UPI0020082610|nr:uncharacterized protein BXZ73DRAFT_45880 [Epithele typhae]KAH9934018.1 hypothetical protein BXZ73DRAFT_45880 [Epithele typhae]